MNYLEELAADRNCLTMSGILRMFGDFKSELFPLSESSPIAERAATRATQSTVKYEKGGSQVTKGEEKKQR